MNKKWSLFFYFVTVAIFGVALYMLVQQGFKIHHATVLKVNEASASATSHNSSNGIFTGLSQNLRQPLAILILQIIVIMISARLFGLLFHKIKQPSVIGEMAAGIVLGPSVTGLLFPNVSKFLFPAASLVNLQFLSQVGLILFMFIIGMELNLGAIRKKAFGAVVISHASIIIPFTLGMGLAGFLFKDFAPAGVSFVPFALFMGIAMSITAFPVLARILHEKGLTKTALGSLAITCAAADDITAWFILAAVIAIAKAGSSLDAVATVGFGLIYIVLMVFLVRPLLKRLPSNSVKEVSMKTPVIALVFIVLLASAYTTELIGIHALFGSFFAGVIMPVNTDFRKMIVDKIEDVSVVLLLPLFFVFTGLRTQITLLNGIHLWAVCGLIVLVAVMGKLGGSSLAAKITGQSWRDSLSIGVLMNTRGLMELIVLNIGYDLGILSPQIFAMMVIMALVTTFLTSPALDLINRFIPEKEKSDATFARRSNIKKETI